jgi:histidine triad (HIT) family protein
MDCLFCKIADKQIAAEVIYEDGDALAILDIHPRALGHTMILSKTHADNILDLPDDKIGPVFAAVKKVTKLLKESLKPDAFTIGINNGKYSGQLIEHLHIHIIPRWQGDGGLSIHSVVDRSPKISLAEVRKKIVG